MFDAAIRGNEDMVECLVKEWQADMEELGRYVDQVDNSCRLGTPLWLAAVSNKLEMVELLIHLGADINAPSDTGCTPVLHACYMNNIEVVKCLVMHGADVQKPDNCGETCLMVASDLSCKELCQIFIENGAELNARCLTLGNTALHYAIIGNHKPDKEDIVQLLIDSGADPFLTNAQGNDAFRTASLEANELILKKLLDAYIPPVECWIESYKLLGASYVINNDIEDGIVLLGKSR